MLQICVALLAGAYALQLFTSLPPAGLLVVVLAVAAFCISIRRLRFAGCVLSGFCVAWHASANLLDDRLPDDLQDSTVEITGRIAGFPEERGESLRFVLKTSDGDRLPSRVRLAWYDFDVQPAIGETWQLKVRLRRPRGFANPVGFDYEQWLFRQGIGATGYVVQHPGNQLLEEVPVATFAVLRRALANRISSVTGDNHAAAVLLAITVGARHRISQQQWEQYAITGTSHLMAISGLHIGLAAGGAFLLFWIGLAPFCRWANLRDRAALMAAFVAVVYAAVSGFAVPAQRAMLMALLVMAASRMRRPTEPETVLAAAAMVVFLTEPVAILSPGFKLSFAAVAILLWSARQRRFTVPGHYGFGRQFLEGMKRLPPLQLTLLFGLLPMTALIFGRVAWLAPLVNLLVLPVFNLLTVPTALLGLLLDGPLRTLGDSLLRVSWLSVRGMLWLIGAVAGWQPARIDIATASPLLIPVVLLAALWAMLPPGWPGRKVAWIAGLCAVLLRPAGAPPGCLDLTVLDVGQGQAMVLRTSRRNLVVDTGPAFRSGGDTGQLVLAPYLRTLGIDRLDLLLVSHGDLDHAGGVASLARSTDIKQVVTGDYLDRLPGPQLRCRRGQAWLWDGVQFAILHPAYAAEGSKNDGSCVVEATVGSHRLLLSGDIESAAENELLVSSSLSPVNLVVVPHHGSRTSSGAHFVQQLHPEVAIVSAGFDNRWGFPDTEVVRRWQSAGAKVLTTATSGAIGYRLCARTGLRALGEYRVDVRRYWHDTAGQ
ncbi:MAG: DNA internalization-related competence protein ComEC/Rec2 [Woeseia sp.]